MRFLLSLFLAAVLLVAAPLSCLATPLSTLSALHSSIEGQRVSSEHVKNFPFLRSGLYNSNIRINFGNSTLSQLARSIGVLDNNFFATAFVYEIYFQILDQIEGNSTLGQLISFNDSVIMTSIESLIQFHDDNEMIPLGNSTGVMHFWPAFYNQTLDEFLQSPENLNWILKEVRTVKSLFVWLEKEFPILTPLIEFLLNFSQGMWPMISDFDDTALNLIVGAGLYNYREKFPLSNQLWLKPSYNQHFANTFELYYKYRYNPFSSSDDLNRIDSSCYYWLRDFLWEQWTEQNSTGKTPELALITVWVANETSLMDFTKKKHIPLGRFAGWPEQYWWPDLNQVVDGVVVSNSLIGLLSTLFAHPDSYQEFITDHSLSLFHDNLLLLQYIINEQWAIRRNDLVSSYYPNVYNFYHFVSRLYQLLGNTDLSVYKGNSPQLYNILFNGLQGLEKALKVQGTASLLNAVLSDPAAGTFYWEDFLGALDQPKAHPADRIYSTSMAANALLNIWTTGVASKFQFAPNTPAQVKETLKGAFLFLDGAVLENPIFSDQYDGSFFSGMNKGPSAWLTFYPSNNGSQYLNKTTGFYEFMFGVSGLMDQKVYEAELSKMKSPAVPIFNSNTWPWPYWSSVAFTQVTALLALVKQTVLVNNGQL